MPHLRTVISGPRAWEADKTIGRAIEIRDGVIQNPKILSFQGRSADVPARPALTPGEKMHRPRSIGDAP